MSSERELVVERADALARQIIDAYQLVGLAIGIVKGGEVAYTRGFGVRRIGARAPVTAHSLFFLASVTKTFVAAATMQLVEAAKMHLDAPVIEYLPYFRLDDERYAQITVRQLLSHTSGLPREWKAPESDDELERHVRGLANARLNNAPGTTYGYSNLGFELLGDAIAKVSGSCFEEYMERHVLRPLGMLSSTFFRDKVAARLEVAPHLYAPHPIRSPVHPYRRAYGPSQGLYSNASEMCNWLIANLDRGTFDGKQLLADASYDHLWHPHIPAGDAGAVGLSWFLGEYRGRRTVRHSGSSIGFSSSVILAPEPRAAAVVLMNSYPLPAGAIAEAVLDVALGLQPPEMKPPVLHQIAKTLADKGRNAAVQRYRDLQTSQPGAYDFSMAQFYQFGWAILRTALGKPREAAGILELAVDIHPESDAYHHLLAMAYEECGDKARAMRSLERCLELNPGHHHAAELLMKLRGQ